MPAEPRAHRVVVATRVFEPEGSAAALRLGALVRQLDAAGFDTTVLTTRPPLPWTPSERIRRWPVLRDRSGAVRGYLQYASFDIPLFFRILFGRRADVIVVEPPPTTGVAVRLAAAVRRTPYVYFSADVTTTAAAGIGVNPVVVAMLRRVEGWVLRGARRVLAISPGVAEEVVGLGARRESVAVVGTGVDTSVFATDGPRQQPEYPYLVYGGTMSEIQGAGVFVEAFALVASRFPDARLLMFGSGVEFDTLRQRAEEVGGGRITVSGVIGAQELAGYIRGAVAGLASVRPERGYDFAFATKALVSLACGTPVVYAGVGPLAAAIRDDDLGWAVGWSADEVADALAAALSAPPPDPRRLSSWVEGNYSARAVATSAVAAVQAALDKL